jgi:hypothetical protein
VIVGVTDPAEAAADLLRPDGERIAGARACAVERPVVAKPARRALGALGVLIVERGLQIGSGNAVGAACVDVARQEQIVDLDADVRVPLAEEDAAGRPAHDAVEELQRVLQAGGLGEVQRQRLAAVAVGAGRGQDAPAGIGQ